MKEFPTHKVKYIRQDTDIIKGTWVMYQSRATHKGKTVATKHYGHWNGNKAILAGGLVVRKKEWLTPVYCELVQIVQ